MRNLIDRLPRASEYIQEFYNDPDIVSQVLAAPEPKGATRPNLSEFTPEVEALMSIVDRLGYVINAVLVAGNRKPPKITPLPRPLTGIQRARNMQDKQTHTALVDEVQQAQARWVARQLERG